MPGIVKPFANIVDVEEVKQFLYGDEYPVGKEWLQECCISLSPMGDHLIIARKTCIVILKSKWDSQEEVKTKYHGTYFLKLGQEENEVITGVLCLPLFAHAKSSHGGPDWTCIAVGFSTGFVRFYTETGNLLIEDLLHPEPVRNLKCQSYEVIHSSTSQEQSEELYVIYHTVFCVLNGFGLFQTLRACRNEVAKVVANCGNIVRTPPLAYKKWGFQVQAEISDSEMAGLASSNTFNHLMTTSLCQDFRDYYPSGSPHMSLVVAVGRKPFVGFHYAVETGAPPPFKDMALAVANKLKFAIGQAVPGWFSGGKKTNNDSKNKDKVVTEAIEPMLCRFGLCDVLRFADRIVMSPNKNFSAVSDGLGRVLLIDNQKGIALRMWKGYRNAQCGWLEVQESVRQSNSWARSVLFLVIYSPNLNCIDVWALQHGSRVASFSADDTKNGRLLYIGYGFMGLNNVVLKDGNKSQFPVVFIDSNGWLKQITVPFYLALSAKDSKQTRDLHKLKELKRMFKRGEQDEDELICEVQRTMLELQTVEVQTQAIEMLASSRFSFPHALQTAVEICTNNFVNRDQKSLDHTSKSLLFMCHKLQKLVTFYNFIHEQHQKPPNYNSVVPAELKSTRTLSNLLHAPEQELHNLFNLISTVESVCGKLGLEPHVVFREDGRTTFINFLSCFEVGCSKSESHMIELKSVSEDKLKCVSVLIYQGILYSDTPVEVWKEAAKLSCIQPIQLMQLALQFWFQKREGASLEDEMLHFTEILKAICSLADINTICAEYNEISPWWQDMRCILMDCANPFMALTAAIACRAVAISMEKINELNHNGGKPLSSNTEIDCTYASNNDTTCQDMSTTPDDETPSSVGEWEKVSHDTCQWTLLISRLEDLAALDIVLKQKPWVENDEPLQRTTESLRICRLPFKRLSVSLSEIIKKGKGSVSEFVAQWLSFSGIDPYLLVDLSDVEFTGRSRVDPATQEYMHFPRRHLESVGIAEGEKMDIEDGTEVTEVNANRTRILDLLRLLKRHFPYSLSSSVLLANICWEYMFSWHQSPDRLEALEAAVLCLQAIPSFHMKFGLCSLVWSTHLKHRFESATKLLQRVGKVPRERLCAQDVGISDLQLSSFFNTCSLFMDIFIDATVINDDTVEKLPQHEELFNCDVLGPPPLAEVALTQPMVNDQLLQLHYQLTLALHMMVHFNMHIDQPLSALFDTVSQSVFFTDLASQVQLPAYNPDARLQNSRTQFLKRVVRAAVQTIYPVDSEALCLDAKQANEWMRKCHLLADVWRIGGDELRRQQICELYSNGFDRLAEEIVATVSDSTLMASQLLVIVGQRIKQMMDNSNNIQNWVSQLPVSLYHWLKNLNEGASPCILWSSKDTTQLLALVLQYLPEGNTEYQLALHMLDALSLMNDDM